jgi:ABC-type branched-subunit amino acid transport system ATPase component
MLLLTDIIRTGQLTNLFNQMKALPNSELTSTQKILKSVEQQSIAKDKVISGLEERIRVELKQIDAYQELDKRHKKLETKLHRDLDSAQSKAKFYRNGFAAASTVATLLGSIMWLINR